MSPFLSASEALHALAVSLFSKQGRHNELVMQVLTKSSISSLMAVASRTRQSGIAVVNRPVGDIPGICCVSRKAPGGERKAQ